MAPTDRTVFPTTPRSILISGNNVQTFKVGATAVKAGMVVSISAAGADFTVIPCVAEAGCCPVGVAIADGALGQQVAVACIGCIARVSNYSTDVDYDAGDYMVPNDAMTPNGGTVIIASGNPMQQLVGRLIEDSTGANLTLDAMLVLCGGVINVHA